MNELTMTLASRNGTPLYEQIYLYIKENIVSGNSHTMRSFRLPERWQSILR